MIVVSDTTPLTYLVQIEHAFLLQRLYERIIVPPAVHDELMRFAPTREGIEELFRAEWIAIREPASLVELPNLTDIGKGEWEALSLAVEMDADLVLMDERLGTSLAKQLHVETIGLLGVLIEAKRRQEVLAVKPLLDRLIAKRFFIHKSLYNKILSLVNE